MLVTYTYLSIQSHDSKTLKDVSQYDLQFSKTYKVYSLTDQSIKLKVGNTCTKEIISNNIKFTLNFKVIKVENHKSIEHLFSRL